MEGADHARVGQQRGRLLGGGACFDLDRARAALEAHRHHRVDDDLARERTREVGERRGVALVGDGDDDELRLRDGVRVRRAAHVADALAALDARAQLGGDALATSGVAAADYHVAAREGEAHGKAAAFRPGAADQGDGARHPQSSIPSWSAVGVAAGSAAHPRRSSLQ